MENKEISKILSLTAKLMELHGENEFKLRSIQNASFTISRLGEPVHSLAAEEVAAIKGIGKSTGQKIASILETGTLPELTKLLADTPAGVVEMMSIKGIGPKKVAQLWKELGIDTPGELLYACNENRLVELKGFGQKTQEQIRKAIEFKISNAGNFHFATLDPIANELLERIGAFEGVASVSITAEMRRKCEVVRSIDFLIATKDRNQVLNVLSELFTIPEDRSANSIECTFLKEDEIFPVHLICCEPEQFVTQLFVTTGSTSHVDEVMRLLPSGTQPFSSEAELYAATGLQFVVPELRDDIDVIQLALHNKVPELISFTDLKGSLHNHSTYSDGWNSLREMAEACKGLGYQYLGICDHSKSAFYANGLSVERIAQQHQEIDLLNKEMAPFTIFKGIESDILFDGSLDYDTATLESFDFIVASVHSGLKMSQEKATERILTAVSNPFTTILGHPTGRLLLAREGYPIDHKAVIDACAENQVIIELNAHPYRLDLDWRWLRYAVSKGVRISINPDAHQVAGFHDMYYGVCAARKGMLTAEMTFNTLTSTEMNEYFRQRKKNKGLPVK